MVRAIIEGRKTQTRRIMKIQPPSDKYQISTLISSTDRSKRKHEGKAHWILIENEYSMKDSDERYFSCPYGQPGDRLWVRETFSTSTKGWIYKADGHDLSKALSTRWKPSIHMPRWASRITLEITNVRVERLQEISKKDAGCEGISEIEVPGVIYPYGGGSPYPKDTECGDIDRFKYLWKSIYGKESWDSNPWVWVVEFRKVTNATT